MSDNPAEDPILTRFRATLAEVYGDRLERVVLYGSRARGPIPITTLPFSSKTPGSLGEEIRRLALITSDILFNPVP